MKIIKRNGSEAVFDISKIIAAVTKANNVVASNQRLTKEQITAIADDVAQECQSRNHAMNVEEIQDLVEDAIMQTKAYEVARKYITYRYVQSLRRTHNTTDDRILSLIECNNEEVKQENANKNPTVNSVQRDYMAGEVSKDLTMRMLLPAEIVKAHEDGIIHFPDADYYAQLAEVLISREVIFSEDVEHIFGKRPWVSRSEEILQDEESAKQEGEKAEKETQEKDLSTGNNNTHERENKTEEKPEKDSENT